MDDAQTDEATLRRHAKLAALRTKREAPTAVLSLDEARQPLRETPSNGSSFDFAATVNDARNRDKMPRHVLPAHDLVPQPVNPTRMTYIIRGAPQQILSNITNADTATRAPVAKAACASSAVCNVITPAIHPATPLPSAGPAVTILARVAPSHRGSTLSPWLDTGAAEFVPRGVAPVLRELPARDARVRIPSLVPSRAVPSLSSDAW